jgi:hypothetical protein
MPTIQEQRANRTPEERHEAFAREYVKSGGKLYASAVSAGFPVASAAVRANELMKRDDILRRIDELLRERFVTEGQKAHATLLALSKRSSPKDAVRLRAAKELMVLGGMFRKADAASHAADVEKRSQAEKVGMCHALANGMVILLCNETPSSGSQTGIKFVNGTYTITNAERAGEWLTKLHADWTTVLPGTVDTRPSLYTPPEADPVEDMPEETDEDEWVAK